jgi:hypothetical protein
MTGVAGVGQQGARTGAVSGHIIGLEHIRGTEVHSLATQVRSDGQDHFTASQTAERTANFRVDPSGCTLGNPSGAIQADAVHEVAPGRSGAGCEGVVLPRLESGFQPTEGHPARKVRVGDLVDAATECGVIVPAADLAQRAGYHPGGRAVHTAGALSGVFQAEAEVHWRGDAGDCLQGRGQGDPRRGPEACCGGRGRVVGLRASQHQLSKELMVVAGLQGCPAEQAGLIGGRVDFRPRHIVVGATLAAAQA